MFVDSLPFDSTEQVPATGERYRSPYRRLTWPSNALYVMGAGSLASRAQEQIPRTKEVRMTIWEWIVVGGAVGLALLLVLTLVRIRRRRASLKKQFGAEYNRAVSDVGTNDAERRLGEIDQTRRKLDLRTLPEATRERYLDE
jgi:type VI protein secretion system component VasK